LSRFLFPLDLGLDFEFDLFTAFRVVSKECQADPLSVIVGDDA